MSAKGLTDSVYQTILAREGNISGAHLEASQIVNYWRSKVVGGFVSAIFLLEACVIPRLLYGSSTWIKMNAVAVSQINNIQNWYIYV